MAQAPKKSAVIVFQAKRTIALPPCILGYADLTKPSPFDPDDPKYRLNAHYDARGIEALKDCITERVYTEEALGKLAEEAGKTLKAPLDPADWLEAKLKEPKEGASIQLPYLVVGGRATRYDRETESRVKKDLGCWDAKGTKLDLKKLRLGLGSTIIPVVYPNLFFNSMVPNPQPSLKLVGVKVLKLVKFSGSGDVAPTDEEEVREVLGADFEYEDLASYAAGTGGSEQDVPDEPEGDDPAAQAGGMF